jgi:hypothetical protein
MEAVFWAYCSAVVLGLASGIVSLGLGSIYNPMGTIWQVLAGVGGPLLAVPIMCLPAWLSISRVSPGAGWIFLTLVGVPTLLVLAWVEATAYEARRPQAE